MARNHTNVELLSTHYGLRTETPGTGSTLPKTCSGPSIRVDSCFRGLHREMGSEDSPRVLMERRRSVQRLAKPFAELALSGDRAIIMAGLGY